jgi:hypothetical protein
VTETSVKPESLAGWECSWRDFWRGCVLWGEKVYMLSASGEVEPNANSVGERKRVFHGRVG